MSCENHDPDVTITKSQIIFDYSDEESLPEVSLSLFFQTQSDVRLASSIKISSQDTGLEWDCRDPYKFLDRNKKEWVGCSKFMSPYGDYIPKGKYQLYYLDSSERDENSDFDIDYPEYYKSFSAKDFPDCIKESYQKKTALYTFDGVLIYFDVPKYFWDSHDSIVSDFKEACIRRDCYIINGIPVVFIMPPEDLENKTYKKQ